MTTQLTTVGRRRFLEGGLAALGGLALPRGLAAQPASPRLAATPAQTAGPFYPVRFPEDADADLVRVRGASTRAQGVVTHLRGRVLGVDGRPIEGANIEIWQCDVHGRYLHPADGGLKDTAFQGFGRVRSGLNGAYAFRTIRPSAYPGRTPHVHFAVSAPGRRRLVTQMYVAGDPLNERDGLYRSLGARSDNLTVRLDPANGIEDGALAGTFDIVL